MARPWISPNLNPPTTQETSLAVSCCIPCFQLFSWRCTGAYLCHYISIAIYYIYIYYINGVNIFIYIHILYTYMYVYISLSPPLCAHVHADVGTPVCISHHVDCLCRCQRQLVLCRPRTPGLSARLSDCMASTLHETGTWMCRPKQRIVLREIASYGITPYSVGRTQESASNSMHCGKVWIRQWRKDLGFTRLQSCA